MGALVDRGGYVTCMQVLGGLFLVESAMLFGAPPSFLEIWALPWELSLFRAHASPAIGRAWASKITVVSILMLCMLSPAQQYK